MVGCRWTRGCRIGCGIKTALDSGVHWLAPDAVGNFSNQLKLIKARIAKSMGVGPQYTAVFPDQAGAEPGFCQSLPTASRHRRGRELVGHVSSANG
jgi:hypothetical protein